MTDVNIRKMGRAGRITLNRPESLNALSHEMCTAIETALDEWEQDADVHVILIDGAGERAFCAGGDIAKMYKAGLEGDFDSPRDFWLDEYRMNAKLAEYDKPIISFLHGFVLGGGVGLGGHVSHRVVGESTQIGMPECGIGFVPDVGGTYRLALAPGRFGEYLGLTGARFGAGDALFTGFADHFVPEAKWPHLKARLVETGDAAEVAKAAEDAPEAELKANQDEIDTMFAGERLNDIVNMLQNSDTGFANKTLGLLSRNAPLSMATTLEMIHRLRGPSLTIRKALELEYRVSHRIMEDGDFLEGVRAAIIDKDKAPKWKHELSSVPSVDVSRLLMPVPGLSEDDAPAETTPTAQAEPEPETTEEFEPMNIGFIGLGNMGGPMAANLAAAGHDVVGFDVAGVEIAGVKTAAAAIDAATGADVVITMLPNGKILKSVAEEIIPVMSSGAVLLDCSTVDVTSARDVAEQAEKASLGALDAPVSGGIGGASAGTLTFMVGGTEEAYATALPLFEIMGQKSVLCGASGNGQAAKICNNMILGITMIGTCEAFAMADKLGLSREAMFDVVSTSSGYSWSMNAYCPAPGVGPQSPADNDYQPGFASELMLKDLRLSQDAASSVDADTPLGQAATALYEQFVEQEDGNGKDFSAMLPRFAGRGRTES